MKIGDLVKSSLMEGQYGIVIEKVISEEQICGFLSKRCLYTVHWACGCVSPSFKHWELEVVDE